MILPQLIMDNSFCSYKVFRKSKPLNVQYQADTRYGRAGQVLETDETLEPFTPQVGVDKRFTSRGGFSAVRSNYINDGYVEEIDEFDRAFLSATPILEPNSTRNR
jgi:hypothetical protein